MVEATKGKEIKSETDLSLDCLNKNHQRKQDFLDAVASAVIKGTPWAIWVIAMIIFLTFVVLLTHYIMNDEWTIIQNVLKDLTMYTVSFLVGLLVKNKVFS